MVDSTRCCIVGGGPAGVILALLLTRRGVATSLLEAHGDFDRVFRGDTVHPSTLEMLDKLGFAEPLLARDHGKLRRMTLHSGETTTVLADFTPAPLALPLYRHDPPGRVSRLHRW